MDPNSLPQLTSPKIENPYDPDSLYAMLEKLPPLDSLLGTDDFKPNAGLDFHFQFDGFENFFENMEVNNNISSEVLMLTQEPYLSSGSDAPLAIENMEVNNNISSDVLMLTQEPYLSSRSDSPLAIENKGHISSNVRREKRTPKKKRNVKNTKRQDKLELSEIRTFFDRPIMKAAIELNVGLTVLKKRCRELGIYRWPHRKLKSLNSLIRNLKGVGMEEEVKNLEEHRVLIEQDPDAELTDGTKKLRQACFKANYKRRKSLDATDDYY